MSSIKGFFTRWLGGCERAGISRLVEMGTYITMDTSTSYMEALGMDWDMFFDFYESFVRISNERYEEIKNSSKEE